MNGWGQGPGQPGQPGWGTPPQQGGQGAPQGQPQHGYGAPQQGYGAPQQGYGAPQQGYGQPGWNGGFGGAPHPDLAKIDSDGQTWLVVGIVGWFIGAVFITGPLAWYMGTQLQQRCEQMGVEPPSNVKYAKMVGMISTILVAFIVVAVAIMLFAMFGLMATAL